MYIYTKNLTIKTIDGVENYYPVPIYECERPCFKNKKVEKKFLLFEKNILKNECKKDINRKHKIYSNNSDIHSDHINFINNMMKVYDRKNKIKKILQ